MQGNELYEKNYKILMKEIKENTEISILPKAIHIFYGITIKISMIFFTENTLKTGKTQMILNSQKILNKMNEACDIGIPDFKIYHKALIMNAAGYWYKNRQIDQYNRIKNPEINPHTCIQLLLTKGARSCTGEEISHLIYYAA
jgi:hypothetical protein